MSKKKMIDINDLLEEQLDPTKNDMIFITGTEEREVTPVENRKIGRLERIKSAAVVVDEPLFDGVTDLDMGLIKLGSESDTQQINKNLLAQKKIMDASDEQRDTIVKEMAGSIPEDVVEDSNLDVPIVPTEIIDRKENKRANSRAVQEIIDDLFRLE